MSDHKRIESMLPRSAIRVVPVNVAINPKNRVAPFEDVRQIVEKAQSLPKKKKFAKALEAGKNWANRLKSLCEDVGFQI